MCSKQCGYAECGLTRILKSMLAVEESLQPMSSCWINSSRSLGQRTKMLMTDHNLAYYQNTCRTFVQKIFFLRAVTCGVWGLFSTSCYVAILHSTLKFPVSSFLGPWNRKYCEENTISRPGNGEGFPTKLRLSS